MSDDYFSQRSARAAPKQLRKRNTVELVASAGRGSAWRHTKTGLREDIGVVCRSGWESNILRILKAWDIPFAYEPEVFPFPIKRGTRSYCPDIHLPRTDEWLEIKGYFDDASRIKIKRFRKYYPDEFARLTLIIGKAKASIQICETLGVPYLFYPEISAKYRDIIKNWEGR